MIEIRDLSVKLGNKHILSDFSASIPDQGSVMICGESGIGKTTLLRVISGLIKPQKGRIDGLDNRKISFVFQEPRLLDYMSALQNVSIVSDRETAEKLLLMLNMADELHIKAASLSGGQKQRVSLARAFAFSDDIVLLDEPFTGLDEQNKICAAEMIRTAALSIVVSHDPSDADLLHINKIITL